MKCPSCGADMELKNTDVSYNSPDASNKYYKRTVFHCEKDDVWVNIEIPSREELIS